MPNGATLSQTEPASSQVRSETTTTPLQRIEFHKVLNKKKAQKKKVKTAFVLQMLTSYLSASKPAASPWSAGNARTDV